MGIQNKIAENVSKRVQNTLYGDKEKHYQKHLL